MPGRGLRAAVLTALGARDYPLILVGRRQITSHIVRLRFSAPALLGDRAIGSAAWARLWFPAGSRLAPRAFTLVRPDQDEGTLDVEFALHDGPASRWARGAEHGDQVTATLTGSSAGSPHHLDRSSLLIGDPASLPAINSLLGEADGPGPRAVLLERQYEDDHDAPVHAGPDTPVVWVDREPEGTALLAALGRLSLSMRLRFDRVWVACEATTTRRVAEVLRREHGIPRERMAARGYWTER